MTSRWSAWRKLGESIGLGVLPRDESIELLHARSGGTSAPGEAMNGIADQLGDLPLALDEAAAYLEETGVNAQTYLGLLKERAAELLLTPHANAGSADQQRVATAWTVSLDRLREQAPMADELLDFCAFCAPDDIPRSLLTDRPELLGPLAELARDPLAFNEAVRAIGRFSMAQVTDDTLSLHRLVQAVVVEPSRGDARPLTCCAPSSSRG